MARGVNKVILVGNCGQDPEVRYLPSGGAVANISIATSEAWKDKNTGQMQERTEWHNVVFFNRLADIVKDYVKKGSKVYIEGSLRTQSWEQDGVKKYKTEIVANEMQMLDSRSDQGGYDQSAAMGQPPQVAPQRAPAKQAAQAGGYNPAAARTAPQQGGYAQPPQQAWNQQPAQQAPQQGGYRPNTRPQGQQGMPQQAPQQPAPAMSNFDDFDDDIPF